MLALYSLLQTFQCLLGWLRSQALRQARKELEREVASTVKTRSAKGERIREDVADLHRHSPERLRKDDGFRRD